MAKLPKIVSMEGRLFRMRSGPIVREPGGRVSLKVDMRYLGRVQGKG